MVEVREGGGVLIMRAYACMQTLAFFLGLLGTRACLRYNLPRIGNALHDRFVPPHGYAGVLGGDDDGGRDGVCRSSYIYHTQTNTQKCTEVDIKKKSGEKKSINCMHTSDRARASA